MKALAISIIALIVSILALSIVVASMDPGVEESCCLEVKYIVFNSSNSFEHVEVVDRVWINNAPDWNNRPFKFKCGSKVTVECPQYLNILGHRAKFSFWQLEESNPTYQGIIVSNRVLTIVLKERKTIWWANYVLEK